MPSVSHSILTETSVQPLGPSKLLLIMASVVEIHNWEESIQSVKTLNSNQKVDLLVTIKLNQIWPSVTKENRCAAPCVLMKVLEKLSGAWGCSVRDLASPQFASCLWDRNIFFMPSSVLCVWNENSSFSFVTKMWAWVYFEGIQMLQQ